MFDIETARIFNRQWQCIARVDQLVNSGDYVCADLPDQPVVVTRGPDGELHAFSRICLHRAMPLAEGSGNATRFVCPYHNWTYELDGRLRSAPMMQGAIRPGTRLSRTTTAPSGAHCACPARRQAKKGTKTFRPFPA